MEAARPGAKDAVIVFRLINDRVEIVDCFQWQSQLRYRHGLAPDVEAILAPPCIFHL